jgi:hypothetical protein
MPYTAKQRRYFHAQAEKGKPGMARLASEADAYAKAGKEKAPVQTPLPIKVTRKQMPTMPGRAAQPGKRYALPSWVEAAAGGISASAPKYTPRKAK